MTRSLYEDDNFKNYLVRIALLSCLGHSTVKLDCFTRRTFVDRFYLKIYKISAGRAPLLLDRATATCATFSLRHRTTAAFFQLT